MEEKKDNFFVLTHISQGRDNLHRSVMSIYMLTARCFWTDAVSLTWSAQLGVLEDNGIFKNTHSRTFLHFDLCPVATWARIPWFMSLSSQDLELSSHLFPKPTSDNHQERRYQMNQAKPRISSPCRNSSLTLYTAFGCHPSPNTGGQKSSRDSLALGGRFVNTPTQRENFGAQLLAAGCVFRSDWGLLQA